jgi:glycogen debranching enzyme
MTGWNAQGGESVQAGSVVVIDGTTFCLSHPNGDMSPDLAQGFFFQDTRMLSTWALHVNNSPLEALSAFTPEPYRGVFLGRGHRADGTEGADDPLLVERRRWVGAGFREDITLRNHSGSEVDCAVTVAVGSDFADLFRVKEGHRGEDPVHREVTDGRISFQAATEGPPARGVVVEGDGWEAAGATLGRRFRIPAHGAETVSLTVSPVVRGVQIPPAFPLHEPLEGSQPAVRLRQWQIKTPVADADAETVVRTLRRSAVDLGSLRIEDPDEPDHVVVAAGAPWFMALFGRDSLLSALMALPLDTALGLSTLQTLARYQGTNVDPLTEEQPGRILHEVRMGSATQLALGGRQVYYGTVDATALFVMVLAELHRWGVAKEEIGELLPNADRAMTWIREFGDRDGDGFVEYERSNESGLINQGWKDSWDSMNFADGRLAQPPIALCEVQGYVYRAYVGRAELAADFGDDKVAELWTERAAELKRRFNEVFWLPDRGYFALALDGDKQPVDSCASNMGHCLWTGIVDEDKAPLVADRLMGPDMFSGWGVRTLSTEMARYNPISYHNGSVWPHDNALVAAGLMRYGFVEHAQRIATALFDASSRFGGRLPELFCGLDREDYPEPVPYPSACSPQAWAAAAPIHLLRVLMRFQPDVPRGSAKLAPAFPPGFGRVMITNLRLAGHTLSLQVDGDRVDVIGFPPELILDLEGTK